jgi:molybdenum cofactor cytidylyltransferase
VRVVAILLAAGEGRRIGMPKALLSTGGTSFLVHLARLLARPGVAEVIAVVGHEAERVEAEARSAGLACVFNARYREGMLGSVLRGLVEAEARHADAVLLHPVDHPLVAAATVDQVVAALDTGAAIAVPSFDGRRGHPGGYARRTFPELRAVSPERGVRAVMADHPEWVVHTPGDPGCITGINTPEEYARAFGKPPQPSGPVSP